MPKGMTYRITSAHRDSYRGKGAARLQGAIGLDWIERLSAAFTDVIEESTAPGYCSPESATQNPLTVVRGPSDIMATNMVPTHPAFRAFIEQSGIAAIVADLVESETLRFWIDAAFEKRGPAGGSATAWHHDVCTWPFWGEQMPILWVPLTDVGPDDTPLKTLDGSHQGGVRYYSPFSRSGLQLRAPYRPWQDLLDATQAPDAPISTWTMPRGDCLIMHPATVHASDAWPEGRQGRRLAISLRWLGADVRWAPDEFAVDIPRLSSHPLMVHGAPPPETLFPLIVGHA
jgi:ectoine hydroxylase-related dioxygenase (phytanoyl-CoA dioxygenase family)